MFLVFMKIVRYRGEIYRNFVKYKCESGRQEIGKYTFFLLLPENVLLKKQSSVSFLFSW